VASGEGGAYGGVGGWVVSGADGADPPAPARKPKKAKKPVVDKAEPQLSAAVDPEFLRQIRIDIGQLNKDSTPEEIQKIIARMVTARLDLLRQDQLIKTIKQQTITPRVSNLRKKAYAFASGEIKIL
jgi:hypothetical protein